MSRFLTKKVSPARRRNPGGAINVRSSSPRKLYSTFADQLGAKAHSIPAPSSQPLLVVLLEAVIDEPVVRLVVAHNACDNQVRVVECGAVRVGKSIAEFAALMNGARRFRRRMARNSTWE